MHMCVPVFVCLIDDPYLVPHSLSSEKWMYVRHKLHHFIVSVPEGHDNSQLVRTPLMMLHVPHSLSDHWGHGGVCYHCAVKGRPGLRDYGSHLFSGGLCSPDGVAATVTWVCRTRHREPQERHVQYHIQHCSGYKWNPAAGHLAESHLIGTVWVGLTTPTGICAIRIALQQLQTWPQQLASAGPREHFASRAEQTYNAFCARRCSVYSFTDCNGEFIQRQCFYWYNEREGVFLWRQKLVSDLYFIVYTCIKLYILCLYSFEDVHYISNFRQFTEHLCYEGDCDITITEGKGNIREKRVDWNIVIYQVQPEMVGVYRVCHGPINNSQWLPQQITIPRRARHMHITPKLTGKLRGQGGGGKRFTNFLAVYLHRSERTWHRLL